MAEDENNLVTPQDLSPQAMEEAMARSEGQLEDPQTFKSFFKKLKEGVLVAVQQVLSKIVQSSKQMQNTGVQISKQQIPEVALGTGELTPGTSINVVAPARERSNFDPGVNVRGGR